MRSFIILGLFLFVLSISAETNPNPSDCSDDAKQLTSLIQNITIHISESIQAEKEERNLFLRNATESKKLLEEEVAKSSSKVRLQKNVIDRSLMRISETKLLLAKYEEENINVKLSAKELQEQCERSDQLFLAKDKEYTQEISLINSLLEFAAKSPTVSTQVLLQKVVQLLATVRPRVPSTFNLIQKDHQQSENFLQSEFITSKNQIETTLRQLLTSSENLQKKNLVDREAASAECKNDLYALDLKLQQNENKTIVAEENLKSYETQLEENKRDLKILEGEFDILNKAFLNKVSIISQISEISSQTQHSFEQEHAQLKDLLQQPLCCLCNKSEN